MSFKTYAKAVIQARQKKKMMFGEQHLVRFGSMSKPAGSDPLAPLQDSDLDPPQVNTILLDPTKLLATHQPTLQQ